MKLETISKHPNKLSRQVDLRKLWQSSFPGESIWASEGISGFWNEEDKEAFLNAGGEICLNKPLDIKRLTQVLEDGRQFGEGYSLKVNLEEID